MADNSGGNIIQLHEDPGPDGTLLTTVAPTPADVGPSGDVYGGWLLSEIETAASMAARQLSGGEVVMAAISEMSFLAPVAADAMVSIYSALLEAEDSDMSIAVEVWQQTPNTERNKVTESVLTYFAVDDAGEPRLVPEHLNKTALGEDED